MGEKKPQTHPGTGGLPSATQTGKVTHVVWDTQSYFLSLGPVSPPQILHLRDVHVSIISRIRDPRTPTGANTFLHLGHSIDLGRWTTGTTTQLPPSLPGAGAWLIHLWGSPWPGYGDPRGSLSAPHSEGGGGHIPERLGHLWRGDRRLLGNWGGDRSVGMRGMRVCACDVELPAMGWVARGRILAGGF